MSHLLHYPLPLLLEPRLDTFEACERHAYDLAFEVPVMASMCRIKTQDAAVIARIKQMVDVRKVIPDHTPHRINPDFTAKHAASFGRRQVQPVISDLTDASHDVGYHT
jgi:hypothetical protein